MPKCTSIHVDVHVYSCLIRRPLLRILPKQNERCYGKAWLGWSLQLLFRLLPYSHQRNIPTEGMLGRHALSMLLLSIPPLPLPLPSPSPPALQPVDCGGVNGHRLLCSDVRTVLEVVMLSLLLCLEVESSQTTQVLLTHCLVDGCPTSNPLTVVVSRVRPPISFRLDKTENHVLHRNRKTWHLQQRNKSLNNWYHYS